MIIFRKPDIEQKEQRVIQKCSNTLDVFELELNTTQKLIKYYSKTISEQCEICEFLAVSRWDILEHFLCVIVSAPGFNSLDIFPMRVRIAQGT